MPIHDLLQTMSKDMFHIPVPILEKILRPVIVYVCLIVLLRVFGKRELAQLNPFDLVVLLSLSNTVQNAIIGDDNSVSGGIIGAIALLAINWILSRALFNSPKLTEILEGEFTILIKDGKVIEHAMKAETLTHVELISVLNKNGFNNPADVALCRLEPNGTFYVKGMSPSSDQVEEKDLHAAIEMLTREVREVRAMLAARG